MTYIAQHSGVASTLTKLRSKFWFFKRGLSVKKIINSVLYSNLSMGNLLYLHLHHSYQSVENVVNIRSRTFVVTMQNPYIFKVFALS